jgi:hypothetical protein
MKELFKNFGEVEDRVDFIRYSERVVPLTSASGVLTIDFSKGTVFTITLTENIDTITFTGADEPNRAYSATLIATQHASSAKTVDLDTNIVWDGGTVPTFTVTTGAVDRYTFETTNQGTTVRGADAGQAFA